MTIEIRRFVMQVVSDRSWASWLAVAATLAVTLVLTAPIGGGNGV
jgi:hypothetical protein